MKQLFLLLLFSQCNLFEKQMIDGGPCSYNSKIYPAKVIGFTTYDSIHWDLIFERNRENNIDSFTYSYATKNYFLIGELKDIKIGNVYQWKEMKIINGHCNPSVNVLLMQPFQSNNLK